MAPDLNTNDSLLEELSAHSYSDFRSNDSTITFKETATGSELIVAKIVAMLVLGLCSFGLGILPVKLASWLHWNKESPSTMKSSSQHFVISLLLCFGGGVLLYTTLLHLQPEVREGMEQLQSSGALPELRHDLHIAELVFCAGFFFVYLVEELVHAVLDRRPHEHEDEAVLHRTMSLRRCSRHPTHSGADGNGDCPGNLIPRVSLNKSSAATNRNLTSSGENLDNIITSGSTGSSVSTSTQGLLNSSLSTIMILESTKHSPLDAEAHMTGGPLAGLSSSKHNHHHHHHHGHGHSHAIPFKDEDDGLSTSSSTVAKSFRGLLAILALSFHAVFEGLAVGLESSVGNVWYLFAAIATHKLVIAFCVGVELISTRTRLVLIFVYLATFAAVTPLGIGVGIALSNGGEDAGTSSVATVVLQGMAAGTLLYVVFFEVLQRERANTQSGIWQLVAIVAGFAVMFALQIITGHEHRHHYQHHDHHYGEGSSDEIFGNLTDHHDHDDDDHHHHHHHHH